MKVIIDTNVWISAYLKPNSTPGLIIANVESSRLLPVLSKQLLNEISDTLMYPKIKKHLDKTGVNPAQLTAKLDLYNIHSDADNPINIVRDHKDNYLLALLIESRANWLITGDNDLLVLQKEYSIISPTDFANKYLIF